MALNSLVTLLRYLSPISPSKEEEDEEERLKVSAKLPAFIVELETASGWEGGTVEGASSSYCSLGEKGIQLLSSLVYLS